jgi:7-cyano-7-deazaguanine synthase in queuosine biosynthesis
MLLASGGLRSLVAAALTLREPQPPRLTLLHVLDGRENAATRREHLRLAADWLNLRAIRELRLPHLFPKDAVRDADGQPDATLVRPQMLLAALAAARAAEASRLIYPWSVDGQAEALTRATQQLQLIEHLADAEGASLPTLEAPLLESSDAQVVQLGDQLGVPWHAAWSCLHKLPTPCRACRACHRRRAAFDAAGLIDTQQAALAGR